MTQDAVHLSHCNMGEWRGCCKYGDDETCPALPENNLNIEEKLIGHLVAFSKDPKTRNKAALDILDRKIIGAKAFLYQGIHNFPSNCGTLIWVIGELGLTLHFNVIEKVLRKGSWEAKNELCQLIIENKIEFYEEDYYT